MIDIVDAKGRYKGVCPECHNFLLFDDEDIQEDIQTVRTTKETSEIFINTFHYVLCPICNKRLIIYNS